MIKWIAYYYEGNLPLIEYHSDVWEWSSLPKTGVVYVDVFFANTRHRLQGLDNYWIDGNKFGVFNDKENEHIYEGHQSMTYKIENDEEICTGEGYPDPSVYTIAGVMLDDNVAKEVGVV